MMIQTQIPLAQLQEKAGLFQPKPYFPERLQRYQTELWHDFLRKGFPTTSQEEWRYFSLSELLKSSISWGEPPATFRNEWSSLWIDLFPIEVDLLVFYNGYWQPHLSRTRSFQVIPFDQAEPEFLESHFGTYVNSIQAPMVALNTALFHQGYVIQSVHEGEIGVLHLFDSDLPLFIQPRLLWILHHPCTIVEVPISVSAVELCVNGVVEYVVEKGVCVHHEQWIPRESPSWYLNTGHFRLEEGAELTQVSVTIGRSRVRSRLEVGLNGEGAKAHLYGLYWAEQQKRIATVTFVDHAVPRCESNELYKGVGLDQAQSAFNGQILVRPEAQETNAYQENRNLLLSDEATVNTKPQLEIFADDVRCTHGATVGQLDEEMIFYLRARGIPVGEAKRLLLHAFIGEILEKSKFPTLQNHFLKAIGLSNERVNETD